MDPLISVVVPTYNRVDLLRRVLHSLLRQTLDHDVYEVIVVDNNSSDATQEMVRRVARMSGGASAAGDRGRGPVVRYVFEAVQGLSHARNTGLSAARGEFVAYTDDDAVPSPDWLRLILENFREAQPAPGVVGGPSFPVFTGRKPAWYRDVHETHTWGSSARHLRRGEVFFGLNVAFRRDCLVQAGGFQTSLGMTGDMLGMGEDTEIFGRLGLDSDSCAVAYYDPRAFVCHLIPDFRTDPAYQLKRSFVCGQTRYQMDKLAGRNVLAGLAYQVLALGWRLAWAGIAAPLESHPGNWLIAWAAPVASKVGYFSAAAGIHPGVRRDH